MDSTRYGSCQTVSESHLATNRDFKAAKTGTRVALFAFTAIPRNDIRCDGQQQLTVMVLLKKADQNNIRRENNTALWVRFGCYFPSEKKDFVYFIPSLCPS